MKAGKDSALLPSPLLNPLINILSCIHIFQRRSIKIKNAILDKLRAIYETGTRHIRHAR